MSDVRVFLDPNGPLTCSIVGSLNATVYGTGTLNDRVKLGTASTAVLDGNIDVVFLPLPANSYSFFTKGNQLHMQVSGATKCYSQGVGNNDSKKIVFANGSVPWTRTGPTMFLGGVAVPVGESAASTLAFTLNTSETYATAGF